MDVSQPPLDGFAYPQFRNKVDRSKFLRDALHRHLTRLASKIDANLRVRTPQSLDEMVLAKIWLAATRGGDRPVLVPTRDPVADQIGAVVVAALCRMERVLVSQLKLTTKEQIADHPIVS